jgi:hypothetical protein
MNSADPARIDELDNLMLLCTRIHTLAHEDGFRIEKDFRDKWFFVKPDGVAVPESAYAARARIFSRLEDFDCGTPASRIPDRAASLKSYLDPEN